MICDVVKDSIVAACVEGEGAPQERLAIEAHMKSCAACREFYEAVKKTGEVFAQAPRMTPDPAVWAAIEEAIEPRPAWWEGWLALPRPAMVFASVAAAFLIVGTVTLTSWQTARRTTAGEIAALALLEEEPSGQDIAESGFGSLAEEFVS